MNHGPLLLRYTLVLLLLAGQCLLPDPAGARLYQVDDLLKAESFGQILIDPTERWLVIERRDPYETAPRFDFDGEMEVTLGRLLVVYLDRPGMARSLVPPEPGAGYVAYGFSPDGSRLAFARLKGRSWELGVVTLASGHISWLGITPELGLTGPMLQWISDTRLVTLAHAEGKLPRLLRIGWEGMADLPGRWSNTAQGQQAAVTAIGSGRFQSITPAPPPTHLVSVDVVTGKNTPLAKGDLLTFRLSPDRRHIALLSEADPIPLRAGEPVGVGTAVRRRRLAILDLRTGRQWLPIPGHDVAEAPMRWSARGNELLAYARHDGTSWAEGGLFRIAPQVKTARSIDMPGIRPIILGLPNFPASVAAMWMGDDPIVYGRAGSAQRLEWFHMSPRRVTALTRGLKMPPPSLAMSARGAGLAIADGRAWTITAGGPPTRLSDAVGLRHLPGMSGDGDPDRDLEMFAAWNRTQTGLNILFFGERAQTLSLAGLGIMEPVAVAPRRRLAVVRQLSSSGVGTLFLADLAGRRIELAAINRRLADIEPARVMPIRSRAPDGSALTHWLYLPPHAPISTPPPLVVIPYPGHVYGEAPPNSQMPGTLSFHTNAQILAARGYAVLLPSMPRPGIARDPAGDFTGQVLMAVDAVLAGRYADGRRLGLWGQSFGGYAAALIATRTDRFRAIISSAGIYDLVSRLGTFAPSARVHPEDGLSISTMTGWTETGQPQVGTLPWSDPLRYIAFSPLFAADHIRTPMLFLHGDRDEVPLEQAEQIFSALYRQGKDAALATYWGEGHVVMSPQNVRDLYARVDDWLRLNMGPIE